MAIVKCAECGSMISDAAAACPKCGAPLKNVVVPDEVEICPFCRSVINEGATVCPSCGAQKGYAYESRYGVMGKTSSIWLGVVLPTVLSPFLLFLPLPIALFFLYRLATGPRWYR